MFESCWMRCARALVRRRIGSGSWRSVTEPYRILALDGGGLRGIFTAAVLCEAEDAYGRAFLERFDLLTGTSTGGIIALGLASGRTAREMLDFYRVAGPRIFSRRRLGHPIFG